MKNEKLSVSAVDRSPSLYEVVSDRLLAAIHEARLPPGSKIPSERELGEQFGVSRTVVREAIRHLAAKGVLETQSGSGVRIADVGHEGVSESVALFLRQRGPVDPIKINEVRDCLELQTTRLAATRATDEQIARIRRECEVLEGVQEDAEQASIADVAFHRAIAEATGNELFLLLLDSLGDVMMQIRLATLGSSERGAVALAQHRAIAIALEARDADAAVAAMKFHLADSLVAYQSTLHA